MWAMRDGIGSLIEHAFRQFPIGLLVITRNPVAREISRLRLGLDFPMAKNARSQ